MKATKLIVCVTSFTFAVAILSLWPVGCAPPPGAPNDEAGGDQASPTIESVVPSQDAARLTIGSIVPSHGLAEGGTVVTIEGTGFESGAKLRFGTREAVRVDVESAVRLTVVAPAHPAGRVDVELTNPDGGAVVLANAFDFGDPVSPANGPVTGGTIVTILAPSTGSGLNASDWVVFAVVDEINSTPRDLVFLQVDAAIDVTILNDSTAIAVSPPHAPGQVAVFIRKNNGNHSLVGNFTYVTVVSQTNPARVVGAISTGNKSVRVAFSKPMTKSDVENASNYVITGSETGFLIVETAVVFDPDHTIVDLTTLTQAPDDYVLRVVGVKDAAGDPLAAPDGLLAPPDGPDPATATFRGTPPVINSGADPPIDQQTDTDGDGLADWFEQVGWFVVVHFEDGTVSTTHVTSDPFSKDTDNDGMSDNEENRHSMDPRSSDTDFDQISDLDEFKVHFSNPNHQDSDEDGIGDFLEITFFKTSPILRDTDGDQMTDSEELLLRNRNPLLADLPRLQVVVDEIRLDVNVISSFTDETNETTSITESLSSSFGQSRTVATGQSATTSTQSDSGGSVKAGGEFGGGATGPFGKVFAEAGGQWSSGRGFSSTVDRQNSETSQSQYDESVTRALEQSESRSVTRTVESAIVQATVTIVNLGDVAFTITNIELSLLQQDRAAGTSFRPIATLRPSGAADPTNQPSFNLGPFDPEIGPIIFESTEVFPNLIDTLMREPTGLVVKVANLDAFDELDRNFVFTNQEVNDLTVGITIDFGDGRVETHRVATASEFDKSGLPKGITMKRALEIIGLDRPETEDQPLPASPPPLPDSTIDSYGWKIVDLLDDSGKTVQVEQLTRVRDIQTNLALFGPSAPPDAEAFGWFVTMSRAGNQLRLTDFSSLPLFARDSVSLVFSRDRDGDGLLERNEFTFGSDDTLVDTDGDGLTDSEEIDEGWMVNKLPGVPTRTFPSPVRADSDLDGLSDFEERELGTDPHRSDTDGDGIADNKEVNGPFKPYILFDGNDDVADDIKLTLAPYNDLAITAGPNGTCDTTPSNDDVGFTGRPAGPFGLCVIPGPDGVLDTVVDPLHDDLVRAVQQIRPGPKGICDTLPNPLTDDVLETQFGDDVCVSGGENLRIESDVKSDDVVLAIHNGLFFTDPLRQDTDFDGLPDGREILLGTNPNDGQDASKVRDSDGDGLSDFEESEGWDVTVTTTDSGLLRDVATDCPAGCTARPITNCPGCTATLATTRVMSEPDLIDSDFDGLPDIIERAIGTDPNKIDTDGDGLFDDEEFDPNNPLFREALALAEIKCEQAENCPGDYRSRLRAPTGTSALSDDTDGDCRSDLDELNESVVVRWTAFRGVPQQADGVMADAANPDTDGDGLSDGVEFCLGTHPNDNDTDGDLVLDNEDNKNGRDPLVAEVRVAVSLVQMTVVKDGDTGTGTGEGEIQFRFTVTAPGASELLLLTTAELNTADNRLPIITASARAIRGWAPSNVHGCNARSDTNPCWEFDDCLDPADAPPEILVWGRPEWKADDGNTLPVSNAPPVEFLISGGDLSVTITTHAREHNGCDNTGPLISQAFPMAFSAPTGAGQGPVTSAPYKHTSENLELEMKAQIAFLFR